MQPNTDLFLSRNEINRVEFLSSFLSLPPQPTNKSLASNWPPPYHPSSVYASLSSNARFDAMRNGTQEDAEEFLGFFLETIGEEMSGNVNGLNGIGGGDSDEWKEVGSKGKTANTRTVSFLFDFLHFYSTG